VYFAEIEREIEFDEKKKNQKKERGGREKE